MGDYDYFNDPNLTGAPKAYRDSVLKFAAREESPAVGVGGRITKKHDDYFGGWTYSRWDKQANGNPGLFHREVRAWRKDGGLQCSFINRLNTNVKYLWWAETVELGEEAIRAYINEGTLPEGAEYFKPEKPRPYGMPPR